MAVKINEKELARYLDQTNLKVEASESEITQFVEDAKKYEFYGVAIMPYWVPLATKILKGSKTTIIAAIGFPSGTIPTESKVEETKWCIENGLPNIEIDMVMNLSWLKSRRYDLVRKEIEEVVKAADGRVVKVIIEAPLLTKDEIVIASLIAEAAGANFVKTSTGFKGFHGWRPTTPEDVRLIRNVVGKQVKVKAAGGIKTTGQALAIIEAGADRIGTSSGVQIVEGLVRLREWKK